MSTTGLEMLHRTLHKTNVGLDNVMGIVRCHMQDAYAILRATLHALRDRLTVKETGQLAAQLPMLIRVLYFEGWDPTGKPVKERHREDFLGRMRREMERYDIDPERPRAVFQVLANGVS